MSWYSLIKESAYAKIIGNSYVVYDAFNIKEKLKPLGFRYDGNKGWAINKDRVPTIENALKALGLDTSINSPAPATQSPQTQQAPKISPLQDTNQTDSPSCPDCGSSMILRTRKDGTGRQFWGCSQFPRCRGITPFVKKDPNQAAPAGSNAENQNSGNWYKQNVALNWELAELQGQPIAFAKDGSQISFVLGDWQPGQDYRQTDEATAATDFVPVVGPDGNKFHSANPLELFDTYYKVKNGNAPDEIPGEITGQKEPWKPLTPEEKAGREKGIISAENITSEQNAIAQSFSQGRNIATAALAGTGKTTEIFHLACNYGRPGEDWQYLVFNTKNKVEAKLKAKQYGIEGFFNSDSTNGYLGKVLEDRANAGKIPPTRRMVSIDKKVPSKIGELLDGPDMANLMKSFTQPLPNPELVDRSTFSKYGQSALPIANSTISILKQLKYEFKSICKKMTGLAKAYAIDPRLGKEHVNQELLKIAKSHDVDFELSKLKERIVKYNPDLSIKVQTELKRILGYNIMDKNIQDEVLQSTELLLNASLPRNTNQEYVHKFSNGRRQTFNLGEMRDFDDDLWFAAINADKLKWPKKKVVMADEAQDFNICQIIALKKLAEAGAQVVIVGDKNQAMYRFRGASDTAIDDMRKMLKIDEPNTLSKNFRCRPAIVDFSNENTIVNNLVRGKRISDKDVQNFFDKARTMPEDKQYLAEMQQKYPGNTNGLDIKKWRTACNEGQEAWPPSAYGVVTNSKINYDGMIHSIMSERKENNGKLRATAILSPTNAELLPAALELLGYGVPFVITGSDLSKELIDHSKGLMYDWDKTKKPWRKVMWDDATPVNKFLDKLHYHNDKENASHSHKAAKEEELKVLNTLTRALDQCVHMYDAKASDGKMPDDIDPNDADAVEAFKMRQQQARSGDPTQGTVGGFLNWLKSKLGGLDIETSENDAMEYMKATEDENNAPVTLSTVHRSKGLEFPVVHILNYSGLVNPKNVTREEDMQQWRHAHYVALTRAKDAMHIISEDE